MLLATIHLHDLWFALPLIAAVSLVYSATRAEHLRPILVNAVRFGGWVVGFMASAFAVLYILSATL
jgi:hypothetical protein